jgi:hypothetical protein
MSTTLLLSRSASDLPRNSSKDALSRELRDRFRCSVKANRSHQGRVGEGKRVLPRPGVKHPLQRRIGYEPAIPEIFSLECLFPARPSRCLQCNHRRTLIAGWPSSPYFKTGIVLQCGLFWEKATNGDLPPIRSAVLNSTHRLVWCSPAWYETMLCGSRSQCGSSARSSRGTGPRSAWPARWASVTPFGAGRARCIIRRAPVAQFGDRQPDNLDRLPPCPPSVAPFGAAPIAVAVSIRPRRPNGFI